MANRSTKKSLERFKYEVADELGVPLSNGYNGDLTAKQNGSVGGYMVKKMIFLYFCLPCFSSSFAVVLCGTILVYALSRKPMLETYVLDDSTSVRPLMSG